MRVGEGTQRDRIVVLLRMESLPLGEAPPGRCWAWCSPVGAAQDQGCPGSGNVLAPEVGLVAHHSCLE